MQLLANNQIPAVDYYGTNLLALTINSSGELNLNNFSDSIGNLNMVEGPTYIANLTTGTTANGNMLSMLGIATVTGFEGSSGVSPAAVIQGANSLDLSSFFSGVGGAATHTFNIGQPALASINPALNINVPITGTAAGSG